MFGGEEKSCCSGSQCSYFLAASLVAVGFWCVGEKKCLEFVSHFKEVV